MKVEKPTQEEKYALMIAEKIKELVTELHDDFEENGENATIFFHCLSTVAPNYIYSAMTSQRISNLEFNHLANTLCFQYSKSSE